MWITDVSYQFSALFHVYYVNVNAVWQEPYRDLLSASLDWYSHAMLQFTMRYWAMIFESAWKKQTVIYNLKQCRGRFRQSENEIMVVQVYGFIFLYISHKVEVPHAPFIPLSLFVQSTDLRICYLQRYPGFLMHQYCYYEFRGVWKNVYEKQDVVLMAEHSGHEIHWGCCYFFFILSFPYKADNARHCLELSLQLKSRFIINILRQIMWVHWSTTIFLSNHPQKYVYGLTAVTRSQFCSLASYICKSESHFRRWKVIFVLMNAPQYVDLRIVFPIWSSYRNYNINSFQQCFIHTYDFAI